MAKKFFADQRQALFNLEHYDAEKIAKLAKTGIDDVEESHTFFMKKNATYKHNAFINYLESDLFGLE